jgi:flagellar basal-body rod protein FlgB
MSISFDKALGIHEQALGFRAQRAEVLANNIANADTPNYKARDLDFSAVLAAQQDKTKNGTFALNMTNSRHIEAQGPEQWGRVAAVSHADAAVDRPEHRRRPAGAIGLRRERGELPGQLYPAQQ